jgi:hypothetical protein
MLRAKLTGFIMPFFRRFLIIICLFWDKGHRKACTLQGQITIISTQSTNKLIQHTLPHTCAEKTKNDALRTAVRVADLLVDSVDGGVQEGAGAVCQRETHRV